MGQTTDEGEQRCELCEPAPHENCEKYTQVEITDPRTRETEAVWVCLGHYEAIDAVVN